MELIIPIKVEKVIKSIGNKTKQNNAYKIYNALLKNSKRADKNGFFPVPSKLLQQVNRRYHTIIQVFIDHKIIDYQTSKGLDPVTFNPILRKSYNVFNGECMRYRFLINTNSGIIKEVDLENPRTYRWYEIIKNSLEELGYKKQKISRVSFGRRVYYSLIPKYKTELKNKGLSIIDAKASQPKLLLNELQNNNIDDYNFKKAFENGFYEFLVEQLNLKEEDNDEEKAREKAKKRFLHYLNGKPCSNDICSLFPKVTEFLNKIKAKNHTDSADFFQRIESKIWIDDLLNNIPVDFALPVHDCLIIKNEEAELVLNYCKEKYPDIDFVLEKL